MTKPGCFHFGFVLLCVNGKTNPVLKRSGFITNTELSTVRERFVCGQIKRWSAVISLPLRHLAYVVVSSVSKLFAACKKHLVGGLCG